MSGYYEGSMKGSGIDNFEFTWGTFTCEDDECGFENIDATAYGDDWVNFEVPCSECDKVHYTGSKQEDKDDYYADYSEDR
jgi:hypothetical protein